MKVMCGENRPNECGRKGTDRQTELSELSLSFHLVPTKVNDDVISAKPRSLTERYLIGIKSPSKMKFCNKILVPNLFHLV